MYKLAILSMLVSFYKLSTSLINFTCHNKSPFCELEAAFWKHFNRIKTQQKETTEYTLCNQINLSCDTMHKHDVGGHK